MEPFEDIKSFFPAHSGLVVVFKDSDGNEYTTPVAGYALLSDHEDPEPHLAVMLIDIDYGNLTRADKTSYDRIEWQTPQYSSCHQCSTS
jgi:hypothetical protein